LIAGSAANYERRRLASPVVRGDFETHVEKMTKLGYLIAAALAISAMAVAWSAWRSLADVAVGTAGIVAMILGAIATLALAGGLMALLFISNRRGFDDEAGGHPHQQKGESTDSH
jgi:asparagine N-glycosylation enzyme membrane subunit Stt3